MPFETQIDTGFDFSTADEDQYASMIGVSPDDISEALSFGSPYSKSE